MLTKAEVRSLLADVENPVLFEIGVGFPEDTVEFISTFNDKDFELFCFEPDPRNIEFFKKTVNDFRVTLVPKAVGNIDGIVEFNLSPGETRLSGSLREPAKALYDIWPQIFGNMKFPKTKVECVKLDTFCKDMDVVDFIWMDVQSAEDLVIDGGLNTLTNKTKYLYTEYGNAEIYKNGYTLKKILTLLPDYDIIKDYGTGGAEGDILLKNRRL